MELAVRSRVVSNAYEEARQPEPTDTQADKTEDIYQTLHSPPVRVTMPPAAPETRWRGWILLSVIVAIFLTILATVVMIHYLRNRETERESWLLHKGFFYLLKPTDVADCDEAIEFCARRNATLAAVNLDNRDWLTKLAEGRRFMLRSEREGSGSDPLMAEDDDTDCLCEPLHADPTASPPFRHTSVLCMRKAC